jgi:phosphatidylserine/phosphatidylglycerophosphate/cardiolipin synthase-like enzyme
VRKSEAFPLFSALLNAIHRGVHVRILTNFYHTFDKPGLIDPLSFLCVAGAECTYFRTVTFLHTKYVQVDSASAIISSVNYDYTSFMSNREAGVIVNGADFQPILKTLTTYFELDLAAGAPWAVNKYNASVMAVINDPTPVPVVIPAPREHKGAYISHMTPVSGTFTDVLVVGNPDNAWDAVHADLQAVTSSIDVFIYQITSDAFCDALATLNSKGVTVTLLVSERIYDETDYYLAKACYTKLYQAGLTIRKTEPYQFEFSHQKFWVLDKKTVWLSSGNWGETDFPSNGDTSFPPFGEANGWRNTNRDHTIRLTNVDLAASFLNLMQEDYSRGYDWSPDSNETHHR